MITSKESLGFQKDISDDMQSGEYKDVYANIESTVDIEFAQVLESIKDEKFDDSAEKALATTSEGEQIYQGSATAILVDIDGNVRAFFSNSQNSPYYETFMKASFEKATARAFLEREKLKGGLANNEKALQQQDFKRHEGAVIPSVKIDGVDCFIGVSGAMVNEDFNRKAMQTEEQFNSTGEVAEWRGAGFWDFICATQIRNFLNDPNAKQEIGRLIVPKKSADNPFFD